MCARRIGIDTGGTFTDVVVLDRGKLAVFKVSSTPTDPAQAVLAGLALARRPGEAVDVVHGTTVGLNAVLTGKLARTAFVTNAGFEDLIEIGRQDRTDLYDLSAAKAIVPVPRALRFGVHSRRCADGRVRARPSRAELTRLVHALRTARVDAVAIGLLHGFAFPEDERTIADALQTLGVPITCSGELLPVSGEFERFCACILNAAIRPAVGSYLERLARPVRPGRLRLMRSSGGIMPAREAHRMPARAMFSGPAGGVLATRALAERAGFAEAAALDMGGTSTDVCLVRRLPALADSTIAGLPLPLPAVEVHTVGCGGGSIAAVDAGGALQVGPASAGADPGPACYGKGMEPTVTDAHIVLGHLGASTLLGGGFPVDPSRSMLAIAALARNLGRSPRQTAEGILQVAQVHMMRALMVITVQRAIDPKQVPLVAFGGAGGLHAEALRRLLGMPAAIVPEHPGAFSAVGLALAGESAELIHPVMRPLDELREGRVLALGERIAGRAKRLLGRSARASVQVVAAVRYAGQGRPITVPLRTPLHTTIAESHERLFGFVPEHRAIELVEIRARAETAATPLPLKRRPNEVRVAHAIAHREPLCGGAAWPVFVRDQLPVRSRVDGPAVVEEHTGATLVPAGSTCMVEPFGLRLCERGFAGGPGRRSGGAEPG
ncbi:MAG: hydantoinase/oxoprolinase family protein [Planctomycetes bacterium]|nr:hydantoinase/oxoprolinase family protein [Planctomycetota bacterium]